MSKPRLSEGRIPFQLGIAPGVVPPSPPGALPYQGDAYYYDSSTGVGSVTGGMVQMGPNQDSPIGSVTGGTVQPSPNQDSPTGSITGGTVLPSEIIYD